MHLHPFSFAYILCLFSISHSITWMANFMQMFIPHWHSKLYSVHKHELYIQIHKFHCDTLNKLITVCVILLSKSFAMNYVFGTPFVGCCDLQALRYSWTCCTKRECILGYFQFIRIHIPQTFRYGILTFLFFYQKVFGSWRAPKIRKLRFICIRFKCFRPIHFM